MKYIRAEVEVILFEEKVVLTESVQKIECTSYGIITPLGDYPTITCYSITSYGPVASDPSITKWICATVDPDSYTGVSLYSSDFAPINCPSV